MNSILNRPSLQHPWEIGTVDVWKFNSSATDESRINSIPGRTVILNQNKNDMGAHRFTWVEKNMIVAVTDMPDYDDRPKNIEHYSKTRKKVGIYGLENLYRNDYTSA
eukprot:CAMPEP_0194157460 /NCGR_PEP_ID=MMETSP0152-20130528/72122_1 /TAXON_ID=1049557 /ORGANISM="Thalassiothrix antarctica, Strain L6-D1" /LENGTH=106 /DNA_ID=CAMNT_0038865867 /DNA_START=1 /DNA_END=317 /DNA_ORIENTATION=+